jgi:hypothetical protein
MKAFQDIDLEKKQAATTRQDSEGVRREVFFSQTLCLSLHVISRDLCNTTCISGQFNHSLREKYVPFKLSCMSHFIQFVNFLSINVSLCPSKNILSGTTLPTFTLSLWGNLLAYIISPNIILINTDSFRTSHDKALDDCKHKT